MYTPEKAIKKQLAYEKPLEPPESNKNVCELSFPTQQCESFKSLNKELGNAASETVSSQQGRRHRGGQGQGRLPWVRPAWAGPGQPPALDFVQGPSSRVLENCKGF